MDRTDRIRQRQVFREASPYEQAQLEARRQRALAEALAQQAYAPMEGAAAPIPSAAPLVQALQGFMAARAGRKAAEELIAGFTPEARRIYDDIQRDLATLK